MLYEIQDIDQYPVAELDQGVGQVPVIDVGTIFHDATSNAALTAIDQIAQACKTWGFFHVVNHGIAASQIEEVWRQTHMLFALPLEQKLELVRSRENPWGFYNNELTKNQRDEKEVFDFTHEGLDPIYHQSNRWPHRRPQFQTTMLAYQEACTTLALNLLKAFCLSLDLPADYLHPHFDGNHTGFVRLNYYPVKETTPPLATRHQDTANLGIHNHTDAGGLTLLLQDRVSGLQVFRDGFWHEVPTVEGAMTINTGDMMQVWSNDIYRAAIHRVRAMDARERYSIPFFLNPMADSRISPVPSVVDENHPSRYRTINWGEFRGRRSDGDFADYGTEVQISQYRI